MPARVPFPPGRQHRLLQNHRFRSAYPSQGVKLSHLHHAPASSFSARAPNSTPSTSKNLAITGEPFIRGSGAVFTSPRLSFCLWLQIARLPAAVCMRLRTLLTGRQITRLFFFLGLFILRYIEVILGAVILSIKNLCDLQEGLVFGLTLSVNIGLSGRLKTGSHILAVDLTGLYSQILDRFLHLCPLLGALDHLALNRPCVHCVNGQYTQINRPYHAFVHAGVKRNAPFTLYQGSFPGARLNSPQTS